MQHDIKCPCGKNHKMKTVIVDFTPKVVKNIEDFKEQMANSLRVLTVILQKAEAPEELIEAALEVVSNSTKGACARYHELVCEGRVPLENQFVHSGKYGTKQI